MFYAFLSTRHRVIVAEFITQIAHKLARQLHSQFHLRTVLADESLTSTTADRGNDLTGDIPIDQAAAVEILRGYLTHSQSDSATMS